MLAGPRWQPNGIPEVRLAADPTFFYPKPKPNSSLKNIKMINIILNGKNREDYLTMIRQQHGRRVVSWDRCPAPKIGYSLHEYLHTRQPF